VTIASSSLEALLGALHDVVGEGSLVTDRDLTVRYLIDQREYLRGETPAVIRPSSTAEVAAVVHLVGEAGFGLVPQGGNTSYCGGATPDRSGRQFVLSLERMTRIRAVDPLGFTIALDAGVVLADAQAAAEAAGLMLPMSLGSQGSARIGGLLGTNAGGLSVLRYGMMRDLLLGIEAVMPDGSVFNAMRPLRKNNTGYDLKQCFVGSEGTLGIITGASLKLIPAQGYRATVWLQLAAGAPLAEMLAVVRRGSADLVSSFEYITATSLGLVGSGGPLRAGAGGVLLVELSASSAAVPLEDLLIATVEELSAAEWIEDAFLASSDRQRNEMWDLRESIPEGERRAGGAVKHDISVPIPAIGPYLAEAGAAVAAYDPALKLSVYGHVGDGNLHYNVLVPPGRDRLAFSAEIEANLAPRLYEIALGLDGAFSAEHGVGRLKRGLLDRYADPTGRTLMRRLKGAFDPANTFNAGAVVDPIDHGA